MWEHRASLSKGTLWRDGHFRNRTTGAWTKTVPPLVFPGRTSGGQKPTVVDGVFTPLVCVSRVWGEPQQDIGYLTGLSWPIFFWKAQPIEVGEEHVSSRKLQNISIKASPTRPFCRLIILQTTPSLGWQSEIWLSRMKSNRKSPEVYTTQQN